MVSLFHKGLYDVLQSDEQRINELKLTLSSIEKEKLNLLNISKTANPNQKSRIAKLILGLCDDARRVLEHLERLEHAEKDNLRRRINEFIQANS